MVKESTGAKTVKRHARNASSSAAKSTLALESQETREEGGDTGRTEISKRVGCRGEKNRSEGEDKKKFGEDIRCALVSTSFAARTREEERETEKINEGEKNNNARGERSGTYVRFEMNECRVLKVARVFLQRENTARASNRV